jgi:uncharacterized protein YnzC (UPF0291/DUF896 family)
MVDGCESHRGSWEDSMSILINTSRRCGRLTVFPRTAATVFALTWTLLVVGLGGCATSQATINVLSAAEDAIRANMHADDELSTALTKQSQDQQAALDQAFLVDFRNLAAQDGGKVTIADLEQGKNLYDQKLSAILTSRAALGKLFENKQRTQQAALDLVQKAEQLSAGETEARNEMEKTQRDTLQLLQSAFQPTVQGTGSAGPKGGAKP